MENLGGSEADSDAGSQTMGSLKLSLELVTTLAIVLLSGLGG